MADASVQQLTKDFADLKTTLQELGHIGSAYGKTAGIMEKTQGKLQATFRKNPLVQVTKQFYGMGKQVKLFHKVTSELTSVTKEQTEENMVSATGMTKLAIQMVSLTFIGKRMAKQVKNNVSLWRRLTMAMMGIMSIFLLVIFAIALVSVAFQGAETPLLDYTEGLGPIDTALKGLIFALTGEGEGGFYGALNLSVTAITAAIPVYILFGGHAAAAAASIVLVLGAYQLVKKATDSSTAGFIGATAMLLILIATFIIFKLVIGGTALSLAALGSTMMGALALGFLAVALITLGFIGLYMVLTDKVTGWLAFAVTAIAAAAIAAGIVIVFGLGVVPFLVIALIIIVVMMVIKHWHAIWNGLGQFITGVGLFLWEVGRILVAFVAGLIATAWGFITALLGVAILFGGAIIGIVLYPFLFVFNVFRALWKSFQVALTGGWKGIKSWLKSIPGMVGKIAKDTAVTVINKIIGIYNAFADVMSFEIPEWVPIIGGGEFKLPHITKLAKGGIVNKPTLAMVGEDGPEAVIPLSKRNNPDGIGLGGGRAPITININASGITDRTDKRALAREIGEAIREEMNRGGRSHGNRRGAL
tara:strand:- start:2022 stop:3785 length:1764 start_codon:yes stop_codon:yes gene_type:complete